MGSARLHFFLVALVASALLLLSMATGGLSLSGQPSALAPGPCGGGGAGTARQLDFSTNLLLGGGGADSEDEDLFGAKSRQAAAEL